MFQNIIFICAGNICRSPVAEGLLKEHLSQKSQSYQVSSAGLTALVGENAAEHSISLLAEKGIDISKHIAQKLSQEMLLNADLILVMEEDHKRDVQKKYPFTTGKVHRLGKWRNEDIADPYKKPLAAFKHMTQHVDDCLEDWIKQFW